MPYHVSKSEFAALVEEALRDLPAEFATALDEVSVEIKDRPTPAQLRSVGLEEDQLLLGLYTGRPLTERSVTDGPRLPDAIQIFQEDCELACDSREELVQQVRMTVLHELGHHFGLDEDDLEGLGYG